MYLSPLSPYMTVRGAISSTLLGATALAGPYAVISPAQAQDVTIPEIVVTAMRSPTRVSEAGSAITVFDGEEFQRRGETTLGQVFQGEPGMMVTNTGGVGTATSVFLRGAASGQTLVMIDGVPANDPSQTGGAFPYEVLSLDNIERVEVLRGPQSALYGSDAMGGVINVISKNPPKRPGLSFYSEGGSYGTIRSGATLGGTFGALGISAGGSVFHTDGFNRTTGGKEDDATDHFTGFVRFKGDVSDRVSIEGALRGEYLNSRYDSSGFSGLIEDGVKSSTRFLSGYVRTRVKSFDDRWTHSITAFGNQTLRKYHDFSFTTGGLVDTDYAGRRYGAEYQGDVKLGRYGTFIYGAGAEQDSVETTGTSGIDKTLDRYHLFVLHQFSIGPRLHLSAGVRYDDFEQSGSATTYRATAAFDLFETDTKLRASVGTGARAPSAYQLFDPVYGNSSLEMEHSFGVDGGFDQYFLDRRAKLSVTGFYNRYKDLIEYYDPDGWLGPIPGTYGNVARAETSGVEVSGSFEVVPRALTLAASYTYLHTEDLATGQALLRRPRHSGMASVIYTGIDDLSLEGRVVYVGERLDYVGSSVATVDDFARVDLFANYKVNDTFELTGRIENLFDKHYHVVEGYETAGFSVYGGARVKF